MASYKVNIPKPCAEPWDKMKPTGCGAFCDSCQKEVIDFTTKPATEIANILHKANGTICGRFNTNQLEHEYEYQPLISSHSWFKKGLIGTTLSLFVAAFNAQAQMATKKPMLQLEVKKESGKVVFSGVVLDDSTKTPLNDVVVTYACNPAYKVVTNYAGKLK